MKKFKDEFEEGGVAFEEIERKATVGDVKEMDREYKKFIKD